MSQSHRTSPTAGATTALVASGLIALAVTLTGLALTGRFGVHITQPQADTAAWGLVAAGAFSALVTAAAVAGRAGRRQSPPSVAMAGPDRAAGDRPRTYQDLPRAGKIVVRVMVGGAIACAIGLVALGMIGSFHSQQEVAHPTFGTWSWTVPIIADVGAILFIQLDFLLAFLKMPIPALRLVTLVWLSGTVALNVAAGWPDPAQMIAHLLMPGVIIVCNELGRSILSRWARRISHHEDHEYEPLPKSWWLLRPGPTAMVWRRRKLNQWTTLAEVKEGEARYELAKGPIRRRYGWTKLRLFWWWRTPNDIRWALTNDQLVSGGDIDKIRRAISKELFGFVLEEVNSRTGAAAPPPARAAAPGPADASPQPRGDLQPPALMPAPVYENGNGGFAHWSETHQTGYLAYEAALQQGRGELDARTLAEKMGGLNEGNARNIRQKKFRPEYRRRHGVDPESGAQILPVNGSGNGNGQPAPQMVLAGHQQTAGPAAGNGTG